MIVIILLVGVLFWVGIDTWVGVTSKWYKAVELNPNITSDDFSVLVPIYGSVKYLQNADYLYPYGDRVVLCTTSGESEELYRDLENIVIRYGFRILRSNYIPRKAGRRRSTSGITRNTVVHDVLLTAPFNSYIVCLDVDTMAQKPLTHIIGALVANKADFASATIIPQKKGPFIVQMQHHEYVASMRARRIMPWLLSGALHTGKTDVMRQIMVRHSLFFQGNDIKSGIIGDTLGYKAVHILAHINTSTPDTLYSWWRQRIAWSGGSFRLFTINFRFVFQHPFLWLYSGIVVISMFVLRWTVVVSPGWTLLLALSIYYAAIVWLHWGHGSKWLIFQPFYCLFVSLIVVPIGVAYYFKMAIPGRNFGAIRPKRKDLVTVG